MAHRKISCISWTITRLSLLMYLRSGEGAVAAEGVLMHDVDVTDGDALGTMIIRGVLDGTKLPANITANQKATLPMITVVGSLS